MHETEMLEVVRADAPARLALADRMAPLRAGKPASWLEEGVRRGRYTVSQVKVGGKPIGVFWWWFSKGNRALVVNAAASLTNEDIFSPLLEGIEALGKQLGALEVQFQTCRRGLVQKGKAAGFVCEGVIMTKML